MSARGKMEAIPPYSHFQLTYTHLPGGFGHIYLVHTAQPVSGVTQHVLKHMAIHDEIMLQEVQTEINVMVRYLSHIVPLRFLALTIAYSASGCSFSFGSSWNPAILLALTESASWSPQYRQSHRRGHPYPHRWVTRGLHLDGVL